MVCGTQWGSGLRQEERFWPHLEFDVQGVENLPILRRPRGFQAMEYLERKAQAKKERLE